MTVSPGARVRFRDEVLFRELDGEAVLLQLGSGRYYGLDQTGTRIWRLLHDHGTLPPVWAELCIEYAVDEATARRDVLELVGRLAACGLVDLEGELDPADR